MAEWKLAGKARSDFADMMEGLTAEQAKQESLCDSWDAHGVLAHVTSFVEVGLGGMLGHMVKSRFDFDRVSVAMADERLDRSVADLAGSLRSNGTKTAPMPSFPEAMTVTDMAIHTQDVRRPLGLDGELDPEVLKTALEFLTTNKKAKMMLALPPMSGVRLVASDTGWSHGTGAEIVGPAESILMALAGRGALNELQGEGLDLWG